MSEPTDSSGWTGPSSAAAPRLRGALVHRYGEHQVSTDFARLVAQADAESKGKEMPPELIGVVGRAWLLLASPLLLGVANQIVHSTGRDLIVQDNKAYLFAWTSAVAALALSQMVLKSLMLIWARKAILVGATLATWASPADTSTSLRNPGRMLWPPRQSEPTNSIERPDAAVSEGPKSSISAPMGQCWAAAAGNLHRTRRRAPSSNDSKGNTDSHG